MRLTRMLLAGAACAMLFACANQKEPAEKAIAKVEAALEGVRAEAQQYATNELKEVDDSVANLKSNFAKQEFGAVVRSAPAVTASITALTATVTRKKAEAAEVLATYQGEWEAMNASVPQLVGDLQNRVDSFTRTRRLPTNFSQEEFSVAKAKLADFKKVWGEASADFAAGKMADAVRKGRTVKTNAEYLLRRLAA